MVLYVVCVIISLQAVAAAEYFERRINMEPNLSPKQKELLKKTYPVAFYSEFGVSDQKIFDELCDLGLVTNEVDFLMITEKGKACIASNRYKVLTDWVPITLSAISIILSIIALFVSISK